MNNLKFNNGKFRIMQIADVQEDFPVNPDTVRLIDAAAEREKPDLVIFTGDQIQGYSGCYRTDTYNKVQKVIAAYVEPLVKRGIPFTMTFGNHDNQGDYSRYYINDVMSTYATADGSEIAEQKFAAFVDFEDDNLFGLTNFYIDLVDDRAKSRDTVDVKYRVHVIDSNTYHFNGTDYDYDVIHDEQLEHAVNIYEQATADKDYIGLAFFHIPLHEFQDAYEEFKRAEDPSLLGQGEFREDALHGYENNGSYGKLKEANVVAFFCGHDHINYGDFIYRANSKAVSDRAIFSYGVKSTNQLYHDTDMIGYKTITLKDLTASDFVTMENIRENFKNFTGGYSRYEND